MNYPWLVLGDFNEILFNSEKEGGRPRTQRQMQLFHDALADCELADIGYVGDLFTWQRGNIRERLDRAVANIAWTTMFPTAILTNSDMTRSDHRPLVVEADTEATNVVADARSKKFEARWLKEDTVEEMVKMA